MITLLAKLFIKNNRRFSDPEVRQRYGILSGAVGIFLNIVLFAVKLSAGLISRSIAIMADAFNNLSDAGSSIITLIGFRIAGKEADSDHPFGHGRAEYISGLLVAVIIVVMAVELLRSSIDKILHPQPILFTPFTLAILVLSILVKLYMFFYNRSLGNQIDSAAMRATAADSFSDAFATAAVLAAIVVSHLSGLNIDGWCGLFVGGIILYTGYEAARDTIRPLLGQAPDPEFIETIRALVMQHEDILGIHDLIVHDYGPGRRMVSLHAEVPAKGDILELHDLIDNMEKLLQKELRCAAVIHMDPIMNEDEETLECRSFMTGLMEEIDPGLTLHDFRIVKGPTHTNLIFDMVVPYQISYSKEELKAMIDERLHKTHPNYYTVIQFDRP